MSYHQDSARSERAFSGAMRPWRLMAPQLEELEARIMLSGASESFPVPLEALGSFGSLVYGGAVARTFDADGETDAFGLELDAGQTITVLVTPQDPSLRIAAELLSPTSITLGGATAPGPGESLVIQTAVAAASGEYTIELTSDLGAGGYELTIFLNAALETESFDGVDNGAIVSGQSIVDSALSMFGGGERLAAVGLGEGASDVFSFSLAAGDYVDLALAVAGGGGPFGHAETDLGGAPAAVAMGRLNNDAFTDAVVLTCDDSDWPGTFSVVVLLANGDGTFTVADTLDLPGRGTAVAVGDLDGDCVAEIVVGYRVGKGGEGEGEGDGEVDAAFGAIAVYLNDGTGAFSLDSDTPTVGVPAAIVLTDMDGDHVVDMVVAETPGDDGGEVVASSGGVSVMIGLGDGSFAPAERLDLGDTRPSGMAVGDVNGDDAPDVVIAGGAFGDESNIASVLLGDGDGGLGGGGAVLTPGLIVDVALADLDGDARLDLITIGRRDPMWEIANGVAVQMGIGDGGFGPWVRYSLGDQSPAAVAIGDLNGDGVLDIATANGRSDFGDWHNTVSVLIGDGSGAMTFDAHYAADVGPIDLAIGDVDGDGDLDIVTANGGEVDWAYVGTVSTLLNRPPVTLSLLDATGQRIAVDADAGYTEVDAAIVGFRPTAAGTYYADVSGVDTGQRYILAVTRNADIELRQDDRAQDISATGQVVAHLSGADEHRFAVEAAGGDVLTLTLMQLWDGAGQPLSDLAVDIELRDGGGTLVATDGDHDGVLQYTAAGAGVYIVIVTCTGGAGDYVLTVDGATPPAVQPLVVTATEPADGAQIGAFPGQYVVHLSAAVDLMTLDAADLLIDGAPAASVALVDGATLVFDISGLTAGDGLYTVSIAAGAFAGISGAAVDEFSAAFGTDSSLLTVVAASLTEGELVAPGPLTLTVTFSDDLDESVLDAADVWLVNLGDLSVIAPGAGFEYDPVARELTAEFYHLDEGGYSVYLLSSPTAFTNAFGATLDGDGDGIGGDPFVLNFGVDVADGPFRSDWVAVLPAGSMVHAAQQTVGFHGAGDVDVLTLDLDAGQTLSITLTPEQVGYLEGRIELRDSAGALVASADASGPGETVVLNTAAVAAAGTYSLGLSSLAGSGAARAYVLLNAAIEIETAGENDDFAGAQDITAGGLPLGGDRYAVIGQVEAADDWTGAPGVDHYGLDLHAGDVVSAYLATFNEVSRRPDLFLTLLDGAGAELAFGAVVENGNVLAEISSFAVPADGTYILRVSNLEGSDSSYTLVAARDAAFNVEPNDSADDAQTLQGVDTALGYLSSSEVSVEPDDFGPGDDLTHAAAGATLSVEGQSSNVVAIDPLFASTGYLGFGHGGHDLWRVGYALLRADFDEPVSDVSIDVAPRRDRDLGWLRAYNAAGDRVASVYSPFGLDAGEVHTLRVRRDQGDIAYITVGGRNSYDSVLLDHLVVGADASDQYGVAVTAGDVITISTATPGDGALWPVNTLDPQVYVYDGSGALVGEDLNSAADGRNALLTFTAATTGVYTVVIAGEGDTRGTYVLDVAGASSPANPAPTVVSVTPPSARQAPDVLYLTFSEGLAASPPLGSSLTVGGVSATDAWFVDGRTLGFAVDIADVEGDYVLELAAGSVTDLQGRTNAAWTGRFGVDRTGPQVLGHSPSPESGVPLEAITFHFDEPIDPATVSLNDVRQFTDGGALNILSAAKYVTVDGADVTVHLVLTDPVAPGAYSMTFGSQLADLAGNVMDQNGDGVGGQSTDRYTAAIDVHGPNLIAESIELGDTSPHFGDTVQITWTVRNTGTRDIAAAFASSIYLSLDGAMDDSDLFLATVDSTAGSPLAPGQAHTQTESLLLELQAGSVEDNYRVLVVVDSAEQIGELSEDDNVGASGVITARLNDYPNLSVGDVIVPDEAFGGQGVLVQWTVTNTGDAATTSALWYDQVYLSRDTHLGDVDDVYLGRAMNGGFLNIGGSYQSSITVTLPAEADEEFYVLVMADAGAADGHNFLTEQTLDRFGNVIPFEFDDGQVVEFGHEDDNVGESNLIDVSVARVPDLQVLHVAAPTAAFTGQSIMVSWTVSNVGQAATGADYWVDAVYLSADQEFDDGDRYLGYAASDGALDPGDSYSASVSVELPLDTVGSYYVFVQTNDGGTVFEHWLAGNNATSAGAPTTIHLTPPPDLEIQDAALQGSLLAGQPIDVTYVIHNAGAGETRAGAWSEAIYASTDTTLEMTGAEADILLGVFDRYGDIAEGGLAEHTFSPVLPEDMVGEYFFFVVTDAEDSVAESDEDNNVVMIAAAGNVEMLPPDLQITWSTAQLTGIAGQTLTVKWTVANLGSGPTPDASWTDLVYAGNRDTGHLAMFECVGALRVGESYTITGVIDIPADMVGAYDFFVETNYPYGHTPSVFEGGADGNNTSDAMTVTITRLDADLQVTGPIMASELDSGQTLDVQWSVRNAGTGTTSAQSWRDSVYLSEDDVLDESDVMLSRWVDGRWRSSQYETSEALAPGEDYAAHESYLIPVEMSGTYYLILSVDDDGEVLESNNGDNIVATEVNITLTPPADLVVTEVNAPADAFSGTWFDVSWTVANNGQQADGDWVDSVWLTADQVVDARVDYYLGRLKHAGPMAQSASYAATRSFRIPDGLSGEYYVYVVTDSGDRVEEFDGESNNAAGGASPVRISLPDPIDLVAGTITIPVDGSPGRSASITYRVDNLSGNAAPGGWQDRLYISADDVWDIDDALFGEVVHGDDLPANDFYTETVEADLPGLTPGAYYVLLRTDIRGQVVETDEDNNFGASLETVLVDCELLPPATPTVDALDDGESMYYRIDVAAGETLYVTLDSDSTDAANEMYLRFGEVPTRGVYDFKFGASFAPDQYILAPVTEAGTYYLLLYGADVPTDSADYTILAEVIDFSAVDETYGVGGTAGNLTIEIHGAKFDRTVTATLSDGEGFQLPAAMLWRTGPSLFYATFDLTQATAGLYDVVISKDSGDSYTVTDGLEVVDGGGSYVRPTGWSADSVRINSVYPVTFVWGNEGINDAPAPMVVFEAGGDIPWLSMDSSMDTVFERLDLLGATTGDSPHGVLMPGQSESITMFARSGVVHDSSHTSTNLFRIGTTVTDTDRPLDWELLRNVIRAVAAPGGMSDAEFEPIFDQLIAQVGPTEADLLAALGANATLWPLEAGCYRQWESLLALEFRKATASLATSIIGKAWSPDFAVDLSFRTVSAYNTDTGDLYTTQTLNDGTFIFETVTPGMYEFGYEAAVIDSGGSVVVGDGEAVTDHVLDVSLGGVVGGAVRQGATPVAGATVTVATAGDEHVYIAETNEDGDFSVTGLVAGTYSVTVVADGYAWRRAAAEVVIVADEQIRRDIDLTPQSTIAGTVDLGGGAMEGALIVTAELTDTAAAGEVFSVSGTTVDYMLDGLPEGTYTLTFVLDGYLANQVADVAIGADEDVAMPVVAMDAAATVSGRVVSLVPGLGVGFLLVGAYRGDATGPESLAITNDSGDFTIHNLTPGDYVIRAVGLPGGVSSEIDASVQLGEDLADIDLTVLIGGVITGVVTDATSGDPMPGVQVTAYLPDGSTRLTTTDAAGAYRFEDLLAGRYTLSLSTDGVDGAETVTVAAMDGSEVAADLSVSVAAGVGGRVTLADGSPIAGATVALYVAGERVLADRTDETGRYDFHMLQTGRFDLRVWSDAAGFAAVTGVLVAADDHIDVDFAAGTGSLEVTVTDATDPVKNASVLLMVNVDGEGVPAGRAVADASGVVTFANLADGDYTVQVIGATGREGHGETVVAGVGGSVSVGLSERLTVTGTITNALGDAVGAAIVMLVSQADPRKAAHGAAAPDGTYQLTGVEAGVYDLTVLVDGYEVYVETGVVVDGAVAADVSLTESTTELTGTIVDAAGNPVPGGTVSVADAAGRFVGTAEAGADGSFVVTTAYGSGLTVRISRDGAAEVQISAVDAPAGASTDLGQVQVQAIAVSQDVVHPPAPAPALTTLAMQLADAGDAPPADGGFDVSVNYPSWLGELWRKEFPRQPERVHFGINGMMDLDAGDGLCRAAGYEAFAAWLLHDNQWDLVESMTEKVEDAAIECAEYLVLESVAALGAGAGLALAIVPLAGVSLGTGGIVLSVAGVLGSLYQMVDFIINGSVAQSLDSTETAYTEAAANAGNTKSAIAGVIDTIREAKGIAWTNQKWATYFKCCSLLGIGMAAYSLVQSIQFTVTFKSLQLVRKLQRKREVLITGGEGPRENGYLYKAEKAEELMTDWKQCFWLNTDYTFDTAPAAPNWTGDWETHTYGAADPNDIVGPDGYGEPRWVPIGRPLEYTIRFENDPELATAPAASVTITQQLDDDLDFRSFRVGDFGFGDVYIDVPDGQSWYADRLDLTSTIGIYLDVAAGIDVATGRVFWQFSSIDPDTGATPVDPAMGFLPPNLNSPDGQGFVTYAVTPRSDAATGAVIDVEATIVFDTNEPMDTPPIFNTIDAEAPDTAVSPLDAQQVSEDFMVTWTGADGPGGSALAAYTIYVARDGGAPEIWLADTTATQATFSGEDDHYYAFYAASRDNAGNTEALPAAPDATTATPQVNDVPLLDLGGDLAFAEGEMLMQTFGFVDPDFGDLWTVEIDFGDGSAPEILNVSATRFDLQHVYADNGVYVVTVTVTDLLGASAVDTLDVLVANVAPLVDAGPDQTVDEGQVVAMAGAFTDPGLADTHTFFWDFGDGLTSSDLSPSHVYADDGFYTASLTVTDDDGGQTTDTLRVMAANAAPTIISLTGDEQTDQGRVCSFVAAAEDPAGAADPLTYQWDFGDGVDPVSGVDLTAVNHIYSDFGGYTLTLTVSDGDGGEDTAAWDIQVNQVVPPVVTGVTVDDGADQRSRVRSLTVTFDQPVVLDSGAVGVIDESGAAVDVAVANVAGDEMTYVVTFTDPALIGQSPADGHYRMVVAADKVHSLGGLTLADDHVTEFFRLFGDIDGDRDVDRGDYIQIRRTLNKSEGQAGFNDAFDYDGDGIVDILDVVEVRARVNTWLDDPQWPAPEDRSGALDAETPRPRVESILVNDGAAQRSMITHLTVIFDQAVLADAAAFVLTDGAGHRIDLAAANPSGDQRTFNLTVAGAAEGVSLADGNYTLTVRPDGLSDAAGRPLTGEDERMTFHRLYGDGDGDRDVDILDFMGLKQTFGAIAGQSPFNSAFDYDGDGIIDITDFVQLKRNFGAQS